jgi:16S rRNA (cytosine1402-N4)-methyltransferase
VDSPVFSHQPVLLAETLVALNIQADGIYIDGTFGRGGHAAEILRRLVEGHLLALDQDPQAVAAGATLRQAQGAAAHFSIEHGNFAEIGRLVNERGWRGKVQGILLDLGVSSPQLDDPGRGFSFLRDGALDMRMNPQAGSSAAAWLHQAGEREIADVLFQYGEEKHGRRIARAIVAARHEKRLETTKQLADIVSAAHPDWPPDKHPATKSFQAIRIFINRELEVLRLALAQVPAILAPGGRLAVISFHSLEDRIVKNFIRDEARGDHFPPGLPVTAAQMQPTLRAIGKPRYPGEAELQANPRARSAVLRVAQRL